MSRKPCVCLRRMIIEDARVQVITAADPEWIFPFTGLQPAQFRKLVRLVAERGGDAIADGRPGRQRALDLPDRVLLVATYWRTNLTMRQIGPLLGVSHSAAHRVIDTLGPLLALAPVRRRPVEQIAIVNGTLVPTRDHRLAARSKNRQTEWRMNAVECQTHLGDAALAMGEQVSARSAWHEALDLLRHVGLPQVAAIQSRLTHLEHPTTAGTRSRD